MKRITKRDLNEGYAIIIGSFSDPRLYFVKGVCVGNGLAVIYSDGAESYSLIDIESGLCVNTRHTKLSEINKFLNDENEMCLLFEKLKSTRKNEEYGDLMKMLLKKEEKACQSKG